MDPLISKALSFIKQTHPIATVNNNQIYYEGRRIILLREGVLIFVMLRDLYNYSLTMLINNDPSIEKIILYTEDLNINNIQNLDNIAKKLIFDTRLKHVVLRKYEFYMGDVFETDYKRSDLYEYYVIPLVSLLSKKMQIDLVKLVIKMLLY